MAQRLEGPTLRAAHSPAHNNFVSTGRIKPDLGGYLAARNVRQSDLQAMRPRAAAFTPQWLEDEPPEQRNPPSVDIIAQSLQQFISSHPQCPIPIDMNSNVIRIVSAWYRLRDENTVLKGELENSLQSPRDRSVSIASSGWTSVPDDRQSASSASSSGAAASDDYHGPAQGDIKKRHKQIAIWDSLVTIAPISSQPVKVTTTRLRTLSPSKREHNISQELKQVGSAGASFAVGRPPQKEGPPKAFSREAARQMFRRRRSNHKKSKNNSGHKKEANNTITDHKSDHDESRKISTNSPVAGPQYNDDPSDTTPGPPDSLMVIGEMSRAISRRNGHPVEQILPQVSDFFFALAPHYQHRYSSPLSSSDMVKAKKLDKGHRQRSDGNILSRMTAAAKLHPTHTPRRESPQPRRFSFDRGQDQMNISRPARTSSHQMSQPEQHNQPSTHAYTLSKSPAAPNQAFYDPACPHPRLPSGSNASRIPSPAFQGPTPRRHFRDSSDSSACPVPSRSSCQDLADLRTASSERQRGLRSSIISTHTTDSDSSHVTTIFHGSKRPGSNGAMGWPVRGIVSRESSLGDITEAMPRSIAPRSVSIAAASAAVSHSSQTESSHLAHADGNDHANNGGNGAAAFRAHRPARSANATAAGESQTPEDSHRRAVPPSHSMLNLHTAARAVIRKMKSHERSND